MDVVTLIASKRKTDKCMIVCAGSTMADYEADVKARIYHGNYDTIGINKITHIIEPDYHLWTNVGRIKAFHDCIKSDSALIIGSKEQKEQNRLAHQYGAHVLDYRDSVKEAYGYSRGCVTGQFRTAGNLAIWLAHLSGYSTIEIAGMDGYMLKYGGNQHCYGAGNTDSDDNEYEKEKDALIYRILNMMHIHCVFSIITPTIYKCFYEDVFGDRQTKDS